jgi:aspartate/methionine/tyrosine aminotransferase
MSAIQVDESIKELQQQQPSSAIATALNSLSSRGRRAAKPLTSYFGAFIEGSKSIYNAQTNPDGYIMFCVAENSLNYGAFWEKLAQHRSAPNTANLYADMTGIFELRAALANYVGGKVSSNKSLDPAHFLLGNGMGSVLNHLFNCINEKGDGVLLPSPQYPAFDNDLSVLANVLPIHFAIEKDNYKITINAMEERRTEFEERELLRFEANKSLYQAVIKNNKKYENSNDFVANLQLDFVAAELTEPKQIKAVLLCNPNNPLGIIHSAEEILSVVEYTQREQLHLVLDEAYMASIFRADSVGDFTSLIRLINDAEHSKGWDLNYLHVVGGLSKDFGISGYRVGWLYTHNPAVKQAWANIGYFSCISNDLQHSLAQILADSTWVGQYLADNCAKLRRNYESCKEMLSSGEFSIEIAVEPVAAMFLWLDFRPFLGPSKAQAENGPKTGKFAAEQQLFREFVEECRVILTPGESCHAEEPGFFRLCFAACEEKALAAGIQRIKAFLLKSRGHLIKRK